MSFIEEKREEELSKPIDPVPDTSGLIQPAISRFGAEMKKIELKIENINYATDKAIEELEEKKKNVKSICDPSKNVIQEQIDSMRVEQDKIMGKFLTNKGIVDEKSASVDQIDAIICELDQEIAKIQADKDKATCDLEERLAVIRERLRSLENLDGVIAALNIQIMEATGHYNAELLDLERQRLEILNRTDLTDEEKAALLAELDRKIQELNESQGSLMDQLQQQKQEAAFALADCQIDDETYASMKNDLLDEINALEAMKLGASPSQLIEINRRLAIAKQQLEELEFLKELMNRGLRLTPSGHIVTSSGRILTIDEAKKLGLLDGLDIDKMMLRERLKQHGIVMTDSGRFITMSGRILTLEDLKALGLFSDAELDMLLAPSSKPTTSTSSLDEDIMSSEDVKYLKLSVGKPLTLALAEIVVKQPRDPIHYLGHWLFKYRYNQEVDEVKKKEIQELEEERDRIKQDRLRQDIEYAAKSCLLDIIFKAHDDASRHKFEELLRLEAEAEEENTLAEEAKDVLGDLNQPPLKKI
ncbi:chromosome partition protein Smc-like [Onthophagus taurus]|uniref:chromosome partition protein Smc-like n=1 Tax=Onthophagus taurus TaxID=166361 RepID=UPI0039BE3F2B